MALPILRALLRLFASFPPPAHGVVKYHGKSPQKQQGCQKKQSQSARRESLLIQIHGISSAPDHTGLFFTKCRCQCHPRVAREPTPCGAGGDGNDFSSPGPLRSDTKPLYLEPLRFSAGSRTVNGKTLTSCPDDPSLPEKQRVA